MSSSSLLVNVPKNPRKESKRKPDKRNLVKSKTTLEQIFGTKEKVQDHYFTDGVSVKKVRNVAKETSPFKFPDELDEPAFRAIKKQWGRIEKRKELALSYKERNAYKSRLQRDVLNRLFVHSKDVKTAKTILDIDSEFYSIVEGRPNAEKFNIQEYIQNIRDVLRTKIITGYRMDDALLIEENLIEEKNMIDDVVKQFTTYHTTFEEYLNHDYDISMELLRQCESESNLSFELFEAYREISKELGSLKSQVSNLEEKWRNCKMYQKFLYSVSPMHWRQEHDHYYKESKNKDDIASIESQHSVFDYNVSGGTEYRSLDEIIEYFLEDNKATHTPKLYFKEPWELLRVFRFIELQNLNSLLHSEELAVPLENVKESMALTETNYNNQIGNLQEIIDNLEGEILWEEDRAGLLESLARELINGEFKRLICDESTLNLHVIVEDVYESRVAPNDANLSAYDMMKAIELKYRECLLKLDYLPYNKVQQAENECYTEEAKVMKVAEEAARKVVQIDRLVRRLRSILEPHKDVHKRQLKKRSMLKQRKVLEIQEERPISEEEAEYFYLFTDFCKETDNIKEYRDFRRKEQALEEKIKETDVDEDTTTSPS